MGLKDSYRRCGGEMFRQTVPDTVVIVNVEL